MFESGRCLFWIIDFTNNKISSRNSRSWPGYGRDSGLKADSECSLFKSNGSVLSCNSVISHSLFDIIGLESRSVSVTPILNDVKFCFETAGSTLTCEEWPNSVTNASGYDLQDLEVVNMLRGRRRGGESAAHSAALNSISLMAGSFTKHYLPYLSVCSGNTWCGGSYFIPDVRIRMIHWYRRGIYRKVLDRTTQVVFEVEVKHRSMPNAHAHCLEYFQIPELCAVVLIKIFPRRTNGTFPALGILYRRNGEGMGSVRDVVSFGTCPLHAKVDRFLHENIPVPVRRLRTPPTDWALHSKNPWTAADQPYITVPAADIFRYRTPIPLSLQRRQGNDFILNLLLIIQAVDVTEDF